MPWAHRGEPPSLTKKSCPKCGSTRLREYGQRNVLGTYRGKKRAIIVPKQQYQCESCGRRTVNPVRK